MPQHLRQLSLRFLVVLICYAASLVVWSAAADSYRSVFRSAGLTFFRAVHATVASNWFVLVEPTELPSSMFDVDLVVLNRQTKTMGRQPIGTKYHAYTPTCMFLSLLAASPIAWRKKLLVGFLGLILLHLWIAFGLSVLVLQAYSTGGALALYVPGDWSARLLSLMMEVVNVSPATKYTVPVFVWIVVSFRAMNWSALLEGDAAGQGELSPDSRRRTP